MSFHLAFRPLHARLCGLTGELSGVPSHTLLALYPVELASYEPFLRHFYAEPCADLEKAHAIYHTVQNVPIGTVELAVLSITEPNHHHHWAKRTTEIPKQVEKFVKGLGGERSREERIAINRQLVIMVNSLRILSMWDEQAFTALKQPIQDNFTSTVNQLVGFFDATLSPAAKLKV